jgi:hypothetical protein
MLSVRGWFAELVSRLLTVDVPSARSPCAAKNSEIQKNSVHLDSR